MVKCRLFAMCCSSGCSAPGAAEGRVVVLSSAAHAMARAPQDLRLLRDGSSALSDAARYRPWDAYGRVGGCKGRTARMHCQRLFVWPVWCVCLQDLIRLAWSLGALCSCAAIFMPRVFLFKPTAASPMMHARMMQNGIWQHPRTSNPCTPAHTLSHTHTLRSPSSPTSCLLESCARG